MVRFYLLGELSNHGFKEMFKDSSSNCVFDGLWLYRIKLTHFRSLKSEIRFKGSENQDTAKESASSVRASFVDP